MKNLFKFLILLISGVVSTLLLPCQMLLLVSGVTSTLGYNIKNLLQSNLIVTWCKFSSLFHIARASIRECSSCTLSSTVNKYNTVVLILGIQIYPIIHKKPLFSRLRSFYLL